jgi:hypothetical protein
MQASRRPGPVLEPFSGGVQAYRVYSLCRRPGPVLEPFSGGVQAYRVYSLCRRKSSFFLVYWHSVQQRVGTNAFEFSKQIQQRQILVTGTKMSMADGLQLAVTCWSAPVTHSTV